MTKPLVESGMDVMAHVEMYAYDSVSKCCMCVYLCVCMCVHLCLCVCMCICLMFIYICVHICPHIYAYTFACMGVCALYNMCIFVYKFINEMVFVRI